MLNFQETKYLLTERYISVILPLYYDNVDKQVIQRTYGDIQWQISLHLKNHQTH